MTLFEQGDTLFVVGTQEQAEGLNRCLPPSCRAVWPGASTMGRSYRRVQKLYTFRTNWEEAWFEAAVLTRLVPGGQYA